MLPVWQFSSLRGLNVRGQSQAKNPSKSDGVGLEMVLDPAILLVFFRRQLDLRKCPTANKLG